MPVIIRVSSFEKSRKETDHEATWLLGHTERIDFGDPWIENGDLFVDAMIRVPCRYLRTASGQDQCRAHGFSGPAPRERRRQEQPRRLGGDRFRLAEGGRLVDRRLLPPPPPATTRRLPVLNGNNPCATARCRTSDGTIGAACCRDLQIEIMCSRRQTRLEALIRSRKAPYLCKVTREGDLSIEAEVISACAYLGEDGIACTLHARTRPDGRPAKPEMCSHWPPRKLRDQLHPGCAFARKVPEAKG
ncbi:MAG: hypothetical protein ACOY71_08305 [Gemmatimonadota bacterium]